MGSSTTSGRGWTRTARLAKYNEQKEALHAGKRPREAGEVATVKTLCNAFLNHKKALLDAGDLSPRTWINYEETARLIVSQFGKNRLVSDLVQEDFAELRAAMSKMWGPVRVRNYIQQTRSVFKYGYDAELLPTPVRFGPGFIRPSKKTLRLARAEKGLRMFEAVEVRMLLNGARVQRGGRERWQGTRSAFARFKGDDSAGCELRLWQRRLRHAPDYTALDLEGGWVNYHRPKTGITRRCSLWPETVAALRAVLAKRREPVDPKHTGIVFITAAGHVWDKGTGDNPISKEMRKYLNALGLKGNRNFYALRHTFETIGGEAKDQVAVDSVMGHVRDDMASVYREPH